MKDDTEMGNKPLLPGHEKVHRSFFPREEGLEVHRAIDVCRSNKRIALELAKKKIIGELEKDKTSTIRKDDEENQRLQMAKTATEMIHNAAVTFRCAHQSAKHALDESLGEDIKNGLHFIGADKEYKGHRILPLV